jgi:hypothetical protein
VIYSLGLEEMSKETPKIFGRVLDPMDRISEVLFGLIMVLTITSSLSVVGAGRDDVHTMLVGALGCNLAWGIIDAIFYLLARLSERGRGIKLLQTIRTTSDADLAHSIIADALPPALASVLSPADLAEMREKLNRLPQLPTRLWLPKNDWLGAMGVFLLVIFSTFPVVIPFIFIKQAALALLVSNGIALVLLFLTGYAYGRYAWHYPWRTGLVMVILGVALVSLTKALGG